MSWTPDIYINKGVMWPDAIRVVRGTTDDTRRYVPEEDCVELRELVRISIEFCNSGCCDECPIQRNDGSCPFGERARELGIEVDGGR